MNSKFKCTASKELLKRLDFESLLPEILLMLKKSYSCQSEFVFFSGSNISCDINSLSVYCHKEWVCKLQSYPLWNLNTGNVLSLTLAKRVGSELWFFFPGFISILCIFNEIALLKLIFYLFIYFHSDVISFSMKLSAKWKNVVSSGNSAVMKKWCFLLFGFPYETNSSFL